MSNWPFSEKNFRRNHFDLLSEVHGAEHELLASTIDTSAKVVIEPAHKYDVNLEPDTFTTEKYELFHNYQRHVHKEKEHEISPGGFRRFLCSGFPQTTVTNLDGSNKRLGSYHQCYRLNGKLIALGVLDLLPQAVSSVYLM